MRPEDLITYGYLVRKTMGEYCNIVASNWWEPTDIKEKSQDEHFPLIFPLGKLNSQLSRLQINLIKKLHSGKYNDCVGESSTNSFATCHKCDKSGHIKGLKIQ